MSKMVCFIEIPKLGSIILYVVYSESQVFYIFFSDA